MSEVTRWREIREKGSAWGMLFTAMLYRLLGRWAAEPLLWGIAAYFFLKDGRTRRCSLDYLERALAGSGAAAPGWKDVYLHYLSFARTSLDRFDVWTDRLDRYRFNAQGEELLTSRLGTGRGAVLLGAHLGNFDTLRAVAQRRGGVVHVMTDYQNSQKFMSTLKKFAPHVDKGMVRYDVTSVDSIFELKQAVQRGEYVGLLGDRVAAGSVRGARRVTPATFLGKTALFPQAPFLFAAHLECAVFLIFSLRRSAGVYDFFVEPFAERIDLAGSREEALSRYVAAYAARLEFYCRRFPYQWFNFYDFWGISS
jgi:predicted LPLAT superfamily acyltransferase